MPAKLMPIEPGIKIAAQMSPEPTEEDLQFARQMGVDHVVLGVMIPDHIPRMANGPRLGMAYTIAYMKALLKRAQEEG